MLIVYDSLTGMAKDFAKQLGYPICDIHDTKDEITESIFLITRSYKFGNVPDLTTDFLCRHKNNVIGCAVTGDVIWGANFGNAGKKIEAEFGIPLIHIFERNGFPEDIKKVSNWIQAYEKQTKERG